MLLGLLLNKLMQYGTLRVIDYKGKSSEYHGTKGPMVTIRLHDRSLNRKIFLNPRLAVGEAYMDGSLTIEEGSNIYDLLDLVGANLHMLDDLKIMRARNRLAQLVRPLQQHNPLGIARKNVAHHYDLSDELFDLFLDPDRQYSCGYFDSPDTTLEQAQKAKKRHLASKLVLDKPGLKTLDIGSGWGGLGIYLHQETK
ncbi:MAG: class I SAM-dependent methyltransferase, partial [Gammaproteobacteria bacterium]|nr:class I SAM-dependent methyltransferase [Gammaproteobacteria bacterium]